MRLAWTVLAMAFVLFLFFYVIVGNSTPPEKQKTFVPFQTNNNNNNNNLYSGSFINVPVNCPPDRVRIGNRCRAIF
ncbi:hypothetical protein K0M31_017360 [Melipona bicolor]|uniref:Uncharacterized protein n=1 Tax=Melipona bicolor TaxID=60889 RepID=A0AA40G590_9HYME|nr:hypothetical protein K0M31_017360 [Melipona bicolor]